ncbi:MAG: GIY-YIG nuclease family protein [Blastocatellia bacterium]|nr:GIY-YIG nuclease family protein [Blastocatellia bacterium]MCS7158266.1 GIY-YIG nuclease family protein [Blastocatellia bacterium]MCX7753104.1 GIY-YIG nuclease family protein [Blastocatellia bacterium]MDW8169418.1 GIY-YIG nuclease family protein [Acidobacteriota bacterium]MDW8255693.1 GIY-YIG nuclease family protein [Acidobacteriota bacterium]
MTGESGVYCVIVRLEREARIRVGRFGLKTFAPGTYVYTGRAARGLRARLARHLQRRKSKRWHIDHLTTHRWARIIGVVVLLGDAARECQVHQRVRAAAQGDVPGFGASDCRSGCRSHLAYFALPRGPATKMMGRRSPERTRKGTMVKAEGLR